MDAMRRFRVSMSGKGYPAYRPTSMTMLSQDQATVDEWVKKQLANWKLDPATADIKYSIVEVKDAPPAPPIEAKAKKAPKKG